MPLERVPLRRKCHGKGWFQLLRQPQIPKISRRCVAAVEEREMEERRHGLRCEMERGRYRTGPEGILPLNVGIVDLEVGDLAPEDTIADSRSSHEEVQERARLDFGRVPELVSDQNSVFVYHHSSEVAHREQPLAHLSQDDLVVDPEALQSATTPHLKQQAIVSGVAARPNPTGFGATEFEDAGMLRDLVPLHLYGNAASSAEAYLDTVVRQV
mmetsp:Transcript_53210/g.134420  ORF Transcript_53210/g.134420 Transcript_53210/m.134420 type:complete len:213 (-) Transcript_53210:81-719(-)